MSRLLLDTNIIISALFWDGVPRKLMSIAIERGEIFITSSELLVELEDTLHKPRLEKYLAKSHKTPVEHVGEFRRLTILVEPETLPTDVVRDLKDVKVLEYAVTGEVDYLVTGDKDLLVLNPYQNIQIVKATDLLTIWEI